MLFAKADVLSINGGTARDWDPHVSRPPAPLASFGLGEVRRELSCVCA